MKKERKEALVRIPLMFLFWIIAELWGFLVVVLAIVNFIITLFTNKRNKNISEFTNLYVSYVYSNIRYLFFTTNERPWPFNKLKEMEKVDFKFQN